MQKLDTAVVLMAGYGTRCLPYTKVLPKAMIPILNKPVIHYIISELEKCGFENAIFVLPKACNGKVVKQYFSVNKNYEEFLRKRNKKDDLLALQNIKSKINIKYVFTPKANGSGGALLSAKRFLRKKDFAVLNGDDLFVGNVLPLQQMLLSYNKTKCSVVGVGDISEEEKHKYGIVEVKQNGFELVLKNLIEKPKANQTKSNLALFGRYVFTNNILKEINNLKQKNGEIYLTDAILNLSQKQNINVCQLKAIRYDCGTAEGILIASNQIKNSEDLIWKI